MKRLLGLFILFALADNLFGQSPSINNFIDSFAKKNNFNGTILIQKKSKITYQKSFGLANFQFKVPNKTETKYKIASITKLFTSVLIMQLYESGKIDLDKTIKIYLPDYKGAGGDKVTIHQLLNHTSGMKNIDTITSIESAVKNGVPVYQKPRTTDELIEKYCSDTLVNEPGKVFDYNNADYIILGKIIEKVYNKTYEQAVKEKFLQPLNMTNSGLLYQQNIIDGLADTYFYRDDIKKLVPDLPVYMANWYAAGSMYSTTNDLLKFSNALFGLKLIKKETLEKLTKPGLDNYGYGIWSYQSELNNKKYNVVKRPGQIMGSQTMLFRFLDEDITIIILSNTGTTSLDNFVYEISKRIVQ
ncbi:MAG: beta-lactamase family protein [Sphingobacteriales bacterium]|nr:beta-lactamase family protein [Sphingobacteriales bacterium]MBI3719778.1 beta-lactamase family protein [Sphingobacteriales bacterium]